MRFYTTNHKHYAESTCTPFEPKSAPGPTTTACPHSIRPGPEIPAYGTRVPLDNPGPDKCWAATHRPWRGTTL